MIIQKVNIWNFKYVFNIIHSTVTAKTCLKLFWSKLFIVLFLPGKSTGSSIAFEAAAHRSFLIEPVAVMSYFSLQYGWHVRDVKFPFNSEYNDVEACWRLHRKSNLHLPEPNTAGLNNQTWQISKTPLDLTKRYPNAGWYEGIMSLEFSEFFESIWC